MCFDPISYDKAEKARKHSKNVQEQLNQAIASGEQLVETQQARVDDTGVTHPTLNERITSDVTKLKNKNDEIVSQLAETTNKTKITGTSLNTFEAPKNGVISFITDDGQIEDYTVAKPIFESAGVPCNAAVISDTIGDTTKYRMTLEQLLDLQNNLGWEILSHTMNHVHLNQLSEAEQEAELKGSIDQLNELGLKCESIAYPFGHYNETIKKLTRKYYRSGRTTDKGLHGINYSPIDTYELKMIFLDSSSSYGNDESGYDANTFDFYKYYIDKNFDTNGWLIITFHSGDILNAGLTSLLEQVVNYAKSKSPIMTFSQALDKIGNIIDIGDKSEVNPRSKHFSVGYDGKISSNNMDVLFSDDAFDGTTPISDFEPYKITLNTLSNTVGQSSNMPDGWGGLLFTYKTVDNKSPNQFFNYQIYHVLITNNVYKRVANNDGTWGQWFKVNTSLFIKEEQLTPDTGINSFKDGISLNNISSSVAQSTNAPIELGGTLITFKNGYNWQEYHVYNSNEIYKRVFTGETPSVWKKISSDTQMPYDQSQQYDTNTTIQTFPLGITYNTVSAARATEIGAPESNGGTLITKKVHASLWGYNFQEYHLYGIGRVYTRSFGSDGTPSAWVTTSN